LGGKNGRNSYKFRITLKNKLGLHARPASIFVETTKKFKSKISLIKNGKAVDAKSIIGVLSLGVSQGDEIEVICEGEDAKETTETLKNLIERLGEFQ